MKKLFILFLAVAVSAGIFAQEDGNLKSKTYFRGGVSIPTWKTYGYSDKSDYPDDIKRMGGMFEAGSIFMLNKIKIANGMRIGINVDYLSLGVNRFSFFNNKEYERFIFVGSKIGPSFSYSPVKHLVFDAFFKINPLWVSANVFTMKETDANDVLHMGYMGMRYSAGFNVRYSVLMVGFEFNPGKAKLRYYDKDNNELTDEYMTTPDGSKKVPFPALNFTIGLNF
jgi:hypothetical protein